MNAAPITIGIVGAGHMGRRYASAASQLENEGRCRIAAIADCCAERACSLAGQLGVPDFRGCPALLEGASPELVIVATPPAQHMHDVIACLAKGAHVLCEKPYALSPPEVAMISRAHRNAGSRLAPMASKYRYDRAVRWARRMVGNGAIGSLLSLDIRFAQAVDMSGRWYSRPEISGGGVLMDNGPHALDLARMFLGPLASVTARRGENARNLAVEETVHVTARGVGGGALRAFLSWAEPVADPYFLRLVGTTGAVQVGWKDSRLLRHGCDEPMEVGEGFDGASAIRAQLQDVLQAIETGGQPEAGFDDAVGNVVAISAAYRSLQTGAVETDVG